MRLRSGAGVLVVAGALLLAASVGEGEAPAGAAIRTTHASKVARVTIHNFMFSPMRLVVSPGETVKVTNKDSATHTLTATDGKFNTGDVRQNQTKSFKAPKKKGTYSYICNIHQYMTGTITVK
jgi:plastocyanin